MRIAVAGSTGFIGTPLVEALRRAGHEVVPVVRRSPRPGEAAWNPETGEIDSAALAGVDAVINLAGETVSGRWTDSKKQRIRDSRLQTTRLLVRTMESRAPRPRVFLCASAIGIYGDRGDEILTEESPPGTGFFPELGREWEAEAAAAARLGIRVVNLRFGIVLDKTGGVLGEMLKPFRWGVGGVLGSGRQYMSWITIEDGIRAILFLLDSDLSGPVNIVAPDPRPNREFTRALASAIKRPAVLPAPAFALRLLFGEMADAALLSSARVLPVRLQDSGFRFDHPNLHAALRHAL